MRGHHFFAKHASLQSTLLCRALSSAERASLQSTLLCRALSAEHASLREWRRVSFGPLEKHMSQLRARSQFCSVSEDAIVEK